MARDMISSRAVVFLILTSLLLHDLAAAPIFANPPAQPPAFTPSPAPAPVSPISPPPANPVGTTPPPPPSPPTSGGGGGGNGQSRKKKSGGLNGGQTAGVVIGVLVALGLLVLGSLVYKKRQSNIKRGRFGLAARRASL